MATLIITAGPDKGDFYPLGQRFTVIGRDEGLPVQIIDPHVSRKHLRIRYQKESGQYLAEDMESRHGTFINGQRIHSPVPLAENDLIDLGGVTLLFTLKDFPDGESALNHLKLAGERYRGTLLE